MTDTNSERALAALLGLELDETATSRRDAEPSAESALPTLDARVEMYLRATRDAEPDAENRREVRELLLDAMAANLLKGEMRRGAPRTPMARPSPLARQRSASSHRHVAAVARKRSLLDFGSFAATVAALLVIGWGGLWGYARHSFSTSLTAWREWESKSGRHYSCASERYGGAPFRIEFDCTDPKATIVTETAEYHIETKAIHIGASLFRPSVIVSEVEGPVTLAELGRPGGFTARWSHAQSTVTGRTLTPEGVSIELAEFELEHVASDRTESVATAKRIAFRAHLDPIATAAAKKSVYDLNSDISAGGMLYGPPIASKPFEARIKAVLHGAGDMIPRTLPARIKGWQRRGGFVDFTRVEFRGSGVDATARGKIELSKQGGIEGDLKLSDDDYHRLFVALTGEIPAKPPSTSNPNVSNTDGTLAAIRFVDGAAYLGSAPLGRLPPLF